MGTCPVVRSGSKPSTSMPLCVCVRQRERERKREIDITSIFKKLGIYLKDQTNLRSHWGEGGPEIN